ncbi:hypothetical protein D3C78_1257450 [compost metagenome]
MVGAQAGTHVGRALSEALLADFRRQAVEMHLAGLADPEDVAAVLVLAGGEQLGQFVEGGLIVQIHGMSPLTVDRKRRICLWVHPNVAGRRAAPCPLVRIST